MSLSIDLYYNSSPPNKVDKDIELVISGTGSLRGETSILDPIILFESDASANMLTKCNYAVVNEFGRNYYITNIIAVTDKLWELHMHVDVLMSYRDQLRQQSGIVSRQENAYNMYFDDNWFMAYQNPHVYTRPFSVAAPFDHQEFVLAVAGN